MRVRPGWRYESVRHSLAAQGIRTGRRYNAEQQLELPGPVTTQAVGEVEPKVAKPGGGFFQSVFGTKESAVTKSREEAAEMQRQKLLQAKAFSERDVGRIIDAIRSSNFDTVNLSGRGDMSLVDAIENLKKFGSPSEYAEVQTALSQKINALVATGNPRSTYAKFEPFLTRVGLKRLAEEEHAQKRELKEGSLTQAAKEYVGTAAVSGLGAVEVAARGVGAGVTGLAGYAEKGLKEAKAGGLMPEKKAGVLSDNVLFGGFEEGRFAPLDKELFSKPLKERFLGGEDEQRRADETRKMQMKKTDNQIQSEVNQLYRARETLAAVDFSPFKKGKAAFERGDREDLLRSITSLEAQEQRLADSWAIVESATRTKVMNPENVTAAYGSGEGFLTFGGGGEKVADRVKKLNEVKQKLKDSINEVYTRRKLLRYDLQRLDATVPPVSDVPKGRVKVAEQVESGMQQWFKVPEQVAPKVILKETFGTRMSKGE